MKNIKGTNVVTVSQDFWIANEKEKKSAMKIVEQGGSCWGVSCDECPLNEDGSDCEGYKMRVDICRKMLGMRNESYTRI